MRIGVVLETFAERPLPEVLDWLATTAPEVTDLEIVAGGYGPTGHCDREALLASEEGRRRWQDEIERRGFRVAALNAWGNPLHPNPSIAARQDRDLRETIRLAAQLDIGRVVAIAGCPGAGPDDRTAPHFAGGAWLPDLEQITEWQWEAVIVPYWSELADFARREHPDVRICLELHPGTCVNNVETFDRLSPVGTNIVANVDPSHFFWQQMDAFAIVDHLAGRIGHAHAKDVRYNPERLALNGLLDRRWPTPAEEMPWSFAAVGKGHNTVWWREFVARLHGSGAETIAIEHEDPFTPPEAGVAAAARILAGLPPSKEGASPAGPTPVD
jgi:sugar phosphate isomerase/epimerase